MKRLSAFLFVAALAGCALHSDGGAGGGSSTSTAGHGGAGLGTDDVTTAKCLYCHGDVGEAWANGSTHSVLLDCNGCHRLGVTFPHEKPGDPLACSGCHSEGGHPLAGSACTDCHDPHGSPNLFLIRAALRVPGGKVVYVRFTDVVGAGPGGLVGAGVPGAKAGTGLCEVCHTKTKVDDAAGEGAPHDGGWCAGCHDHQAGFKSPPDAGAGGQMP